MTSDLVAWRTARMHRGSDPLDRRRLPDVNGNGGCIAPGTWTSCCALPLCHVGRCSVSYAVAARGGKPPVAFISENAQVLWDSREPGAKT